MKFFLQQITLLLPLLLAMGMSFPVSSKEKEIRLTPDGCLAFAQVTEQMRLEKPKYSRQDRLEELRLAALEPDLESVARKIIDMVYGSDKPPTGENFLNFCYKNEGRITVEERERL